MLTHAYTLCIVFISTHRSLRWKIFSVTNLKSSPVFFLQAFHNHPFRPEWDVKRGINSFVSLSSGCSVKNSTKPEHSSRSLLKIANKSLFSCNRPRNLNCGGIFLAGQPHASPLYEVPDQNTFFHWFLVLHQSGSPSHNPGCRII